MQNYLGSVNLTSVQIEYSVPMLHVNLNTIPNTQIFQFLQPLRALKQPVSSTKQMLTNLYEQEVTKLVYFPGYELPWEDRSFIYPGNFASPLEIAIEASNGASDYGNKFGEPVLAGFARSFGMEIFDGDRREYIKPVMFSGGMGQLEGSHVRKQSAEKGIILA